MFNHHSYFTGEQIVNFRRFIATNRQNIDLITSQLMMAMGFKLHLCGSLYLREAIKYCYLLPENTKVKFCKTVYPHLAEELHANVHNVERDIRTAILNCYQNGNMFAFNDLCGWEMISKQYPPTNGEFITNVVSWIRSFDLEYGSRSL